LGHIGQQPWPLLEYWQTWEDTDALPLAEVHSSQALSMRGCCTAGHACMWLQAFMWKVTALLHTQLLKNSKFDLEVTQPSLFNPANSCIGKAAAAHGQRQST
jgi:hypothetical protein